MIIYLQHAPGVPKVLVGNRLHLAFKRKVGERDAQQYAEKHSMAFFEVSPLCNFNILESFCELSRMALQRNGMERLWRSNKGIICNFICFIHQIIVSLNVTVLSLQELCCRAIVARTTVYSIEQLPLPTCVKSHLKSYALTTPCTQLKYTYSQRKHLNKKMKFVSTPTSPGSDTRSCVPRNSCTIS